MGFFKARYISLVSKFSKNEDKNKSKENKKDIKRPSSTTYATINAGKSNNQDIKKTIVPNAAASLESLISPIQDLTFSYTEAVASNKKIFFTTNQKKDYGILRNDGKYTNLGLLLSDQCRHSIKVAIYSGLDKSVFKDRREFTGSILKQLADAYEYIDLSNKTSTVLKDLERIDIKELPSEEIREALINAIVHRDYSFSGSTIVNIFDDRMEVVSIGGLVPGLSLEAVMMGASQSRNPKLAKFFYDIKLIESYGTGINKIMSIYKDKPEKAQIKAAEGGFQVILPKFIEKNDIDEKADIIADKTSSDQESKVIDLLSKQKNVSRKDIEQHLNVKQARALKILKAMVERGLIKKVGTGKDVYYQKK